MLSTSLPATLFFVNFSSFVVRNSSSCFLCRQSRRCFLIAPWSKVRAAGSWPLTTATANAMTKKPQFDPPICSCTRTFVMVILGLRVCSIVASCLRTVVETSVGIKLSKISTLPLQQLRFDVQIQWLLSLMICTNCSGTDFHFFPSFRAFVGCSPFCCGNCFFKRDWARLMTSQFSQWPSTNSSRPSACYTPSKPLCRSSPSRQFACSTPSKSS